MSSSVSDQGSFDYVIVGSGAAGAILASRLTENPKITVCVLESGPSDWDPMLRIPAGYIKKVFDPKVSWPLTTEQTEHTGGRRIPVPQGRALGGSTSINGLVYNRGQAEDFDDWAAAGNPGWSYADVLPYFKKSEHKYGEGSDEHHGRSGPLKVTDMDWFHPISEAFMKGAQELGIPRNPDYNSGKQAGVGYYQRSIHNGFRMSTARAFLRPAMKRPNLTVRTHSQATKVLFEGKRAIGVQYVKGGRGGATHRVCKRTAR